MLQARVQAIYYIHDWQHPIKALHEQYEKYKRGWVCTNSRLLIQMKNGRILGALNRRQTRVK
jgi:hypothetical protein